MSNVTAVLWQIAGLLGATVCVLALVCVMIGIVRGMRSGEEWRRSRHE